jgi:hypothetical protein
VRFLDSVALSRIMYTYQMASKHVARQSGVVRLPASHSTTPSSLQGAHTSAPSQLPRVPNTHFAPGNDVKFNRQFGKHLGEEPRHTAEFPGLDIRHRSECTYSLPTSIFTESCTYGCPGSIHAMDGESRRNAPTYFKTFSRPSTRRCA